MLKTLLKEIDGILENKNNKIEFLEWQNKRLEERVKKLEKEIEELEKKEDNEDE